MGIRHNDLKCLELDDSLALLNEISPNMWRWGPTYAWRKGGVNIQLWHNDVNDISEVYHSINILEEKRIQKWINRGSKHPSQKTQPSQAFCKQNTKSSEMYWFKGNSISLSFKEEGGQVPNRCFECVVNIYFFNVLKTRTAAFSK